MTKFTEGRHPGEGLFSEANGHRSREVITIVAGSGVVGPGTVVGQITASKKFAPAPAAETAGIEGAEIAKAITLYPVDATTADQKVTAIARDAEWNASTLTYEASVDTDAEKLAKATQLAAVGIILR